MLLFSLLLFTRVKVLCPLKSNDTNKKMHALIPKNEVASFALALGKSFQVEKLYQDLAPFCVIAFIEASRIFDLLLLLLLECAMYF